MTAQDSTLPRAVVLGVQLPGEDDLAFESSLRELERLGNTLGLQICARVTQRLDHLDVAAVVGSGKLKELGALTGGSGVLERFQKKPQRKDLRGVEEDEAELESDETESEGDELDAEATKGSQATVVLVDHDLTPNQVRNLERATGAEVVDRTSLILKIFQRHARSRAAILQVEIARLSYEAPRLRESGGGQDRQRGGIGGRGAGESALELDRRKIRDRIAELRRELESIERDSGTRRARRAEHNTVALVGYTNAGKSSLMRALTAGEIYVADKLFATLDTTVRALSPEARPRILVSDTVGFIKKLPHALVASFRSTLDEAAEADFVLHVVDASDGAFRDQMLVTEAVLQEVGASQPRLLLLNKADLLDEAAREALAEEYPEAMQLSAKSKEDVAALRQRIIDFFDARGVQATLFVPYTKQKLTATLHESTRVLSERHDETGTYLEVRGAPEVIARVERELAEPTA